MNFNTTNNNNTQNTEGGINNTDFIKFCLSFNNFTTFLSFKYFGSESSRYSEKTFDLFYSALFYFPVFYTLPEVNFDRIIKKINFEDFLNNKIYFIKVCALDEVYPYRNIPTVFISNQNSTFENPSFIAFTAMSYNEFFNFHTVNYLRGDMNDPKKNSAIIVSFDYLSMSFIKAAFRYLSINLSSGNNNSKGIVSRQAFSLINFFNICWNPKVTEHLIDLVSRKVLAKKATLTQILKYKNLSLDEEKLLYSICNPNIYEEEVMCLDELFKFRFKPSSSPKLYLNDNSILAPVNRIRKKTTINKQIDNKKEFHSITSHNSNNIIRDNIQTNNLNHSVPDPSKGAEQEQHSQPETLFSNSFYLVYNNLINIIKNNPINKETQIKIETYLFNQFKEIVERKEDIFISSVNFSLFNKEFKVYCFNKIDEINFYIDSLINTYNSNDTLQKDIHEINKAKDIYDFYFKNILNRIDSNVVVNSIFYILFVVVTFNDMILEGDDVNNDEITKTDLTSISLNLGKHLTNSFILHLMKEYNEVNPQNKLSLRVFKESLINKDKWYIINSNEFYIHISAKILEIMTTLEIVELKVINVNDKSLTILKLSPNISILLKKSNPIAVLPLNLPMIVEPKPYSENVLGGFLLNDVQYDNSLISSKIAYDIPSTFEDNSAYNTINNMMKIPFKINNNLLEYLVSYNHKHKLLIDYEHEYASIKKRTKYQEKEYQQFLSKKSLQQHILLIAQIFSSVPEIYFPLKLDNRGRMYPNTAYLHYQGSELAKALIIFSRPDKIKRYDYTSIEYLKAYGASCFGNGLNKKSYTKRLEWVNENWEKIVSFENHIEFVHTAEDKFLFLAFCFEMKRFDKFLNSSADEFRTFLPIQLDGTCNGFQHLALLSNETEVFDKLNLSKASKNDDPQDFYSHIVDILMVHLEEKCLNSSNEDLKNSYNRLIKFGISRKIVKPAIMNKPYNAKSRTLTKYVRDSLIYSHSEKVKVNNEKTNEIEDKSISWYKLDVKSKEFLNYDDINLLVECVEEIIFVKYQNIKLLKEYFEDMVKILNKLNLPIIWRLPTGLNVTQKYMKRHTLQIKPFSYLSNSITLTITDKIKIDKIKQISALMPNLVHSLDASTLLLLFNSLYNSIISEDNNVNFYGVHDCYAVTAKYVDNLIKILRSIYISIYSGKGYIEKFDEDIIKFIISSYGEDKCKFSLENRIIYIEKKKIKLPDISKFLLCPNKDRVYKSLSESVFLVT